MLTVTIPRFVEPLSSVLHDAAERPPISTKSSLPVPIPGGQLHIGERHGGGRDIRAKEMRPTRK